jgi:hypothetical protein
MYTWFKDNTKLSAPTLQVAPSAPEKLDFNTFKAPIGANRVHVNLQFTDGTFTASHDFPLKDTKLFAIATAYITVPTTTTTLPAGQPCEITVEASVMRACGKFKSRTDQWWDNSKALSGLSGGSTVLAKDTVNFSERGAPSNATRVLISIDLIDGRKISPIFIPYGNPAKVTIMAPTVVPPTSSTLPPCKISIDSKGYLTPCRPFVSYEYRMCNDTRCSAIQSGTAALSRNQIYVGGDSTITRIQLTIKLSNGKSYTDVFIPYTWKGSTSIDLP